MDWTYDASDNAYTLIRGALRCCVWLTTLGTWAAVFVQRGISTAAYNFATPEEAQTWCETQAAEGRSTADA
jgi:hypothetical protein